MLAERTNGGARPSRTSGSSDRRGHDPDRVETSDVGVVARVLGLEHVAPGIGHRSDLYPGRRIGGPRPVRTVGGTDRGCRPGNGDVGERRGHHVVGVIERCVVGIEQTEPHGRVGLVATEFGTGQASLDDPSAGGGNIDDEGVPLVPVGRVEMGRTAAARADEVARTAALTLRHGSEPEVGSITGAEGVIGTGADGIRRIAHRHREQILGDRETADVDAVQHHLAEGRLGEVEDLDLHLLIGNSGHDHLRIGDPHVAGLARLIGEAVARRNVQSSGRRRAFVGHPHDGSKGGGIGGALHLAGAGVPATDVHGERCEHHQRNEQERGGGEDEAGLLRCRRSGAGLDRIIS